jgi:hypothetical protein
MYCNMYVFTGYGTCGRLGRGKWPSEGAIQNEIAGSEVRVVIGQGGLQHLCVVQ